ncbi:MAG: cellulose synthase complex outer membrane protein BcsC [Alcaligenaceae bacterium]|nr:cellulose synthase complex outer membrane protein BcsC [Alcaligenaceae bacterium]
MKRLRLSVLAVLAGGALHLPAHASSEAQDRAAGQLVEQIHMGESIYRDDLIQDAVRRLYRIAPEHPEGLAAELRLAVQRGRMDQAQALLARLKAAAPESDAYRQGEALLRLSSGPAAETLTRARLYSAAGRVDEARKAYDEVFQGVYPTADLALEYWQLRAREAGGRPAAVQALTALLRAYPRHAGLLSALAGHSFNDGDPERGLEYLRRLARQPAQRETAANREYEYLSTLPTGAESVAALRSFIERYPDLAVAGRARDRLSHQAALLADPAWRGGREALRLVEQGAGAAAVARLRTALQAYPDDAELHGALGLAYLRMGDRTRALQQFELAKNKEDRVDNASRWVSLIESTRYWLLLQNASAAAERADWATAQRLYEQAHRQDPADIFALIGLGDAALAFGRREAARDYFLRAFKAAPADESTVRALGRYLAGEPPERALALLDRMPAAQQPRLAGLRRDARLALLEERAARAMARSDWTQAADALAQAQQLNMDDPWLSYRLATALRSGGRGPEALAAYERHLRLHAAAAPSRYAHALLLESADRLQDARDSLARIPRAAWSPEMQDLDQRLAARQRILHADALYQAGKPREAIAFLESQSPTPAIRLQLAAWYLEQGDSDKAMAGYMAILREDPDNTDARLGRLETMAARGQTAELRRIMDAGVPALAPDDANGRRRLAALWGAAGDPDRQRRELDAAVADAKGPQPWLLRDYARATAPARPQAALQLYERAMREGALLPVEAAAGDRAAFTRATRERPGDDWLALSIRRDAEALYQRENPTLTLSHDTGLRRDGTPGLSRLNANTTILQLDHPVAGGKGYLRADHVRMNAGAFDTNEAGLVDERFGTCIFEGRDGQGELQALPACASGFRQKASGTSFAVGWQGERLSFDLGRTPQGFAVTNWTGGVTYKGDLKQLGWSLTASRRPMSNSLLSFAGARDPRTGITWGGVMATGASLGLSWDQGGADGVWADLSHHRLTGKNVADNHRTRLMAGYYRRLINQPDESLSVGVNVMHWRYQKDLGEYTLGHGGYYSPQRYSSISLPVSYARRRGDWSFLLEGSVSRSVSRSSGSNYYPLPGLLAGPLGELGRMGVTPGGFLAANEIVASKGSGFGYTLRGMAERRLSNHWVVGAGFDLQHGQDYTPSRVMLYLRYTFEP